MPRPRTPIQLAAQLFHRNPGHRAGRIHLLDRRSEKQFHSFFLQQVAVAVEISRISRQIFVRSKLRGIYKNRRRHNIAISLGGPNQRQVPFMQRSHGGHESQSPAAAPRCTARRPHVFDGLADFHRWENCFRGWRSNRWRHARLRGRLRQCRGFVESQFCPLRSRRLLIHQDRDCAPIRPGR